jgi:hypothetical protein
MEDKNLNVNTHRGLENQFEKIRVDLLSIHMYGIANQIRFLTLWTCEQTISRQIYVVTPPPHNNKRRFFKKKKKTTREDGDFEAEYHCPRSSYSLFLFHKTLKIMLMSR